MRVLITGANGMVAKAMADHCFRAGDEVVALPRAELDITDSKQARGTIADVRPDVVVNCAAYTDVDGAENEQEKCFAVNAFGPENLAAACRDIDALLITISTDFVFDGSFDGFYTQRHTPAPASVYARSKFEGELRVRAANARAIIVRSGWIYGTGGTNFLSVMPDLLEAGKTIKAISNAYGTPTYAADLARRIRELAVLDLPCIFHVTNAGSGTTYEGFAREVCRIGGFDVSLIESVSKDSLRRPAARPDSSKMACLFSERFGLGPMPDWIEALERFIGG